MAKTTKSAADANILAVVSTSIGFAFGASPNFFIGSGAGAGFGVDFGSSTLAFGFLGTGFLSTGFFFSTAFTLTVSVFGVAFFSTGFASTDFGFGFGLGAAGFAETLTAAFFSFF